MNNRKLVLSLVAMAIVLVIIGSMDYNDEQIEYQHYCEMVELWQSNNHLPPEQRPGWPPYKGECDGQD